jgi:hypothetical protein
MGWMERGRRRVSARGWPAVARLHECFLVGTAARGKRGTGAPPCPAGAVGCPLSHAGVGSSGTVRTLAGRGRPAAAATAGSALVKRRERRERGIGERERQNTYNRRGPRARQNPAPVPSRRAQPLRRSVKSRPWRAGRGGGPGRGAVGRETVRRDTPRGTGRAEKKRKAHAHRASYQSTRHLLTHDTGHHSLGRQAGRAHAGVGLGGQHRVCECFVGVFLAVCVEKQRVSGLLSLFTALLFAARARPICAREAGSGGETESLRALWPARPRRAARPVTHTHTPRPKESPLPTSDGPGAAVVFRRRRRRRRDSPQQKKPCRRSAAAPRSPSSSWRWRRAAAACLPPRARRAASAARANRELIKRLS